MLETSPGAVRQMLSRASKKLGQSPAPEREDTGLSAMLSQIVQAIHQTDAEGVVRLLAQDAALYSDGGGKVRAAINPVFGARRIARFLIGIERKNPGRNIFSGQVNGEPALLFTMEGRRDVVIIDIAEGVIQRILQVSNPEKLGQVGRNWTPLPR
ncbi:hypothetical protein [Glutamicibacter sp. M10]|uniref:hypothetical protein n=1 Tax=Glutamicibacter sp. M10 TaxID=3023076 RepID=UPI0021C6AB93|nr:hypothetical protein [Glutamicibacter sp. M10]UXN32841.1 hypothetical protein N6V40_05195 [Glutamicibacter sp. M10]